jgi:hypothetical protein
MIGGVRSPMATSGHGLVGSKTDMYRRGIDNATSHKSAASGSTIKSPRPAKENV